MKFENDLRESAKSTCLIAYADKICPIETEIVAYCSIGHEKAAEVG